MMRMSNEFACLFVITLTTKTNIRVLECCWIMWYVNALGIILLLLLHISISLSCIVVFTWKTKPSRDCAIYLSLFVLTWMFNNRNARSRSCPFCRGSLKRVNSKDLWVLTNNHEIVDSITIARENLTRFRLYIESLPPAIPDTHTLVYDYMIWTWADDKLWCRNNNSQGSTKEADHWLYIVSGSTVTFRL